MTPAIHVSRHAHQDDAWPPHTSSQRAHHDDAPPPRATRSQLVLGRVNDKHYRLLAEARLRALTSGHTSDTTQPAAGHPLAMHPASS